MLLDALSSFYSQIGSICQSSVIKRISCEFLIMALRFIQGTVLFFEIMEKGVKEAVLLSYHKVSGK